MSAAGQQPTLKPAFHCCTVSQLLIRPQPVVISYNLAQDLQITSPRRTIPDASKSTLKSIVVAALSMAYDTSVVVERSRQANRGLTKF
jgi:hypothetical protein